MDEAFGGDPGLSRKELDHDQRHATYNLSCQVRLRTTLRNLTSGLGFIGAVDGWSREEDHEGYLCTELDSHLASHRY